MDNHRPSPAGDVGELGVFYIGKIVFFGAFLGGTPVFGHFFTLREYFPLKTVIFPGPAQGGQW